MNRSLSSEIPKRKEFLGLLLYQISKKYLNVSKESGTHWERRFSFTLVGKSVFYGTNESNLFFLLWILRMKCCKEIIGATICRAVPCDVRQVATAIKCIIPDACYTIRYFYTCKTGTPTKCHTPYACHASRYLDTYYLPLLEYSQG